jgi:S1-C subfamily serine protease
MEILMTTPDFAPLQSFSTSISWLVDAVAPSIVSVHSHRARSSGFVWKRGLIVTADEALADEGDVAIALPGGDRVSATIVGRDPTTDIALLRADRSDFAPVALDGAGPSVGALAVAVGGRDGAAVAALGIVAASGPAWRSMRGGEIDARIELDLSIRRSSEGGVAVNTAGQVFGMTVFGPRRRVLVIPAATIAHVAAQLETHGKVPRGYLGLGLQPVRLERDQGVGAMVMSVDAEGPGAKAGVQQGDVIVTWDGQPVGHVAALLRSLGPVSVGTTITLGLRRGGDTRSVELVIGERPDD